MYRDFRGIFEILGPRNLKSFCSRTWHLQFGMQYIFRREGIGSSGAARLCAIRAVFIANRWLLSILSCENAYTKTICAPICLQIMIKALLNKMQYKPGIITLYMCTKKFKNAVFTTEILKITQFVVDT